MSETDERSDVVGGALALLRSDPWLVVPFVLAGVAVGGLEALRLLVGVPVADGSFPARGELFLRVPFLPSGTSVARTDPAMLPGLKLPFLAAVLAVSAAESLVLALSAGAFCWRARTGGWLPPWRAMAWLLAYGLVVGVGGTALQVFAAPVGELGVLAVLVFVPLALVVFPLPGALVLDRVGPWSALRRSASVVGQRPVGLALPVLLAGYAGYLLTGLAALGGGPTVAGALIGAGVSTAAAGTVLAAVLVTAYRSSRPAGTAADETDGSLAGAD